MSVVGIALLVPGSKKSEIRGGIISFDEMPLHLRLSFRFVYNHGYVALYRLIVVYGSVDRTVFGVILRLAVRSLKSLQDEKCQPHWCGIDC